MKKISLLVLFLIIAVFGFNGMLQAEADKDLTPRIAFWPGKVNQHFDVEKESWATDPDGKSGGHSYLKFQNDYGGRELDYCKKWYPNTIEVVDYKLEVISGWKDAGNKNNHTTTKMTKECVQPDTTAPDVFNVSPADGTVMQGTSVFQSWGSNATDVDYFIYESYRDADATNSRHTAKIYSTNKTANNVAEAEYWWRVKAVDEVGNIGEWSPLWKITIDNTAPEIEAPEEQNFEALGPNESYPLTQATATDNVDKDVSIDYSPKTFGLGETEITWTATDDAGNSSTATSIVTIEDTTGPEITLEGNNPFDLYINNDYEEPGFSAIDLVDGDLTDEVIVEGDDFDITVLGAHEITYTVTDENENSTTVTRIVNIVDRDKPIIYRLGVSPVIVEGGSLYEDAGATAIDRDGSDITGSIIVSGWDMNTLILGLFEIYYDVTGADLGDITGTNIADQAKRKIEVVDTTGPTITVNPITVNLLVGDSFDEMSGVSATDIIDGDLTSSVITGGTFDGTESEGTYTITYNVSDNSGNPAIEVVRTITIITPDTIDPKIEQIDEVNYSIIAINDSTIEVLFDEELQDNTEGHHPSISDFNVYNDINKLDYGISDVTYANKIVTIKLTNPIMSGHMPRLYITPVELEPKSLVDLSGNYFNDGLEFDAPVIDRIIPVITLNGDATVNLIVGDSYTDLGATCTDVFDSKCEVESESNLNTNLAGEYTITYFIEDSAGNKASEVIRNINVTESTRKSSGSYISGFGRVLGAQTGGEVLGEEKFIFIQFMKRGMRGGEIPKLQEFLNAKGHTCGAVDGIFGSKTESCVKEFQTANPPLKVDGIVGVKTREVLNK